MDAVQIKEQYEEWISAIAKSRPLEEFIAHFREHVGEHFTRHKREGELSMLVWMVGVLNFLHIFEELFPNVTYKDLLFKLCRHHVNRPDGAEPPFDMVKFLAEYDGPIGKFHRKTPPCSVGL